MKCLRVGWVCLVIACISISMAQMIPPLLIVDGDKDNGKSSKRLPISSLNVKVTVHGHIAETKMTMVFSNPSDRVLAGDLHFPLPEGATVSGYALDIKGQMVDGVVVEKQKGRQVFEKIVRRGIDPGLVEWVKGNNFKTRVFPIPAGGSRTVRVDYISTLIDTSMDKGGCEYYLPLNFQEKLKKFDLRIEVIKNASKPLVIGGGSHLEKLRFSPWRDSYVAELSLKDVLLNKGLSVQIPQKSTSNIRVEKGPDGLYYFALFNDVPPPPDVKTIIPKRIGLIWDASGSRENYDFSRDYKLLKTYFSKFKKSVIKVDLVVFRHTRESTRSFTIKQGKGEALLNYIKEIQYDGGTNMGAIAPVPSDKLPDFYMLFSDGLSNFGKETTPRFEKPLYILSGDTRANHGYLRNLAVKTGGFYFNLAKVRDKDVLSGIGKPSTRFSHAEISEINKKNAPSGDPKLFPAASVPVIRDFSMAGQFTANQIKLTLHYAHGHKVYAKKTYKIKRGAAAKGNLLRRFWAQKKLEALSVFPVENKEEITNIGKKFGFVTPGTSLLVLENLEQYIEYEVEPPISLPETREAYFARLNTQKRNQKNSEKLWLDKVVGQWMEQVTWWNTDFKIPSFEKELQKSKKSDMRRRPSSPRSSSAPSAEEMDDMVMESSVSSAGTQSPSSPPPSPKKAASNKEREDTGPTITLKPWNPETPYLKLLEKAGPAQWKQMYFAQRKEHGSIAAFYLDCGDFFLRKKKSQMALQVLSNISELQLEDATLLRVLAHKLSQIKKLDLAIFFFEKILEMRPEEPQSYRDLALVLADKAQNLKNKKSVKNNDGHKKITKYKNERARLFERAIWLLNKVVITKWDRFEGIEMIALMELNRLIPMAKATGVINLGVDSRLIKPLPVGVRIVLTWDADLTDMDLWVTEPTGEKAMYSHPKTEIGGRMSRDFTQGYGPETYLLKKMMKGKYIIQANYYGNRSPNLTGAVTLQATIFTHYGTKKEKRKAITLRLKNQKDEILVGEIELGK